MIEIRPSVRATAIGSLTPDSASRVTAGRRRRPVVRRVEKTAAASVEPTTAPSSSDFSADRSNSTYAAAADTPAVMKTPTVPSESAGTSTERICRHSALSPPSKRMIASPMMPTSRASSALLKSMPPGPSEPSSMPMPRKATRMGTLSRLAA